MSRKLLNILQKIAANPAFNPQLPEGAQVRYGNGPAVGGSFLRGAAKGLIPSFTNIGPAAPIGQGIFRDQTPEGTKIKYPAPTQAEVQQANAARKARIAARPGMQQGGRGNPAYPQQ